MKESQKKRWLIIGTFTFLLLLGVPVWWKTMEIKRSDNVDHDLIRSLTGRNNIKETTWNIDLITHLIENNQPRDYDPSYFEKLQKLISVKLSKMNSKNLRPERFNFKSAHVTIHKDTISKELNSNDQALDEYLNRQYCADYENGKYGIIFLYDSAITTPFEITMGNYRHLLVKYSKKFDRDELVQQLSNHIFIWLSPKVLMIHLFFLQFQQTIFFQKQWDTTVAVYPPSSLRVSFNLINADPKDKLVSWDFNAFEGK